MRGIVLFAAIAACVAAMGEVDLSAGGNNGKGEPIARQDSTRKPADQERQSNWFDEARPAGEKIPPAQDDSQGLNPGEIRQYIAGITNLAITPSQFSEMTSRLCDEDARRISGQVKSIDLRAHDALMRSFRDQWKSRYGDEFDLARQTSVTGSYYVLRGERTAEEAIVASHHASGGNGSAKYPEHPADAARVATVLIPGNAEQRQPAMILILANEKPGGADWRLNVPDSLSAGRLMANIDGRLSRMLEGTIPWPADPREAYRLVAYQVMAALNDQPADRPRERPAEDRGPAERDNPSIES